MADVSLAAVVRHLRQLAPLSADARDDRELLDAFAIRLDQAAFTVLVQRHGGIVGRVGQSPSLPTTSWSLRERAALLG